jgi:hypothetical protein
MKKVVYNLLMILCICLSFVLRSAAQAPSSIPYQAVARDAGGVIVQNRSIGLRISIHDFISTGAVVYSEAQSVTTNVLGSFTANIGQGTSLSGAFNTINWGGGSKFIQIEMDILGGTAYVDMGTKQMLSVPYALYCNSGAGWKASNTSVVLENNNAAVGIGTTSPLMKLHVAKSDSAALLLENTQNLSSGVNTGMYFKTGDGTFQYTGAIKTIGTNALSARMGLFTYASQNPNSLIERFSISDLGNAGIGTTNPLMILHVAKSDSTSLLLENTQSLQSGVNTGMYFKTGGSTNFQYLGAIKTIGSSTSTARMGFFTYASSSPSLLSERFSITDAGIVGVGVTNPYHAKFEVDGSVGSAVAMFRSGGNGVTISGNNPEIGFNFFYNGGAKTIKAGYASNIGMFPSTGDIYIGNFNGAVSTTDYGAITGYQNCMYIKQNGNIGIGTANPTYKLAVNGTIRTKEVIVETGWADFVFEKDYKLPSLKEVEQFIKNNKHLPEIPSAQEIQKNGLSVGEIQTKMMQKIEELTLYVIELQKQIDELKKK